VKVLRHDLTRSDLSPSIHKFDEELIQASAEPFGSEPLDELRVSSRVEKLKAELLC
jgi:hypothetical protein